MDKNLFVYLYFLNCYRIKEWLNLIEKFKLPPLDQVPDETIEVCNKFQEYKTKCIRDIVKNQRFHYKYYQNVFNGSQLIDWLLSQNLVKSRQEGLELGRKLIFGRVITHVSHKRNFYDGFHLYKFSN
jgi:hypothetical protein